MSNILASPRQHNRPARIRRRPLNTISGVTNVGFHAIFIVYALACILPVVVVLSVSLSTELSIVEHGYGVFPRDFTLKAYEFLFTSSNDIFEAYRNTIIATVLGTSIAVIQISRNLDSRNTDSAIRISAVPTRFSVSNLFYLLSFLHDAL